MSTRAFQTLSVGKTWQPPMEGGAAGWAGEAGAAVGAGTVGTGAEDGGSVGLGAPDRPLEQASPAPKSKSERDCLSAFNGPG